MRRSRTGVSTGLAAVVIAVVFVIAAVGGYLLEGGIASSSTTTSTTSSSSTFSAMSSSSSSLASSTTSVTSTSSTSGPNQTAVMAQLAAAAEAECAGQQTCLTIYTTQDAGNWNIYYGPAFDQQYPWAAGKVDYVSLSASDETTDALSQYETHSVIADLLTGTLAQLIPVYQGGALMNYSDPEVQFMNYTTDAVGPAWVETDLAPVFMIYNPTLLPANEVPTSWADLANPAYKGELIFQSPAALDITAAEFYYLSTTMSNSSWTSLMQGIAKNHPGTPGTAGQAEAAVLNGQAEIGVDTLDQYITTIRGDPSAPLKIVNIEPIVYSPAAVAITAGAPDPAMAKLVQAWFVSQAGQEAEVATNHIPYQGSIGAPLLSYLPPGAKLVDAYGTYETTPLFQNPGVWSDNFEYIFGV